MWHSKNPGLSQSTVGFNVSEVTSAEFLAPGPSYLAPSSATFMPSYGSEKPIHLLVSQDRCEMLLQQYWTCVHPIARVVHRPSFERRWEEFWQIVSSDREVPKSLEAIVSAVMFCSMVSLSEEFVPQAMGGNKQTWVGKLQSTTEKALSAANWLRTTKVETLQALVIYLVSSTTLHIWSTKTCRPIFEMCTCLRMSSFGRKTYLLLLDTTLPR